MESERASGSGSWGAMGTSGESGGGGKGGDDDSSFTYSCPVFRTRNRGTNVRIQHGQNTASLMGIDLPSRTQQPDHWVLRAVVLLRGRGD